MAYRDSVLDEYAKCHGRRFKNPNQVLSEHEVETIRKLYIRGISQKQLSERFGVSQAHISNIVNCRRWK